MAGRTSSSSYPSTKAIDAEAGFDEKTYLLEKTDQPPLSFSKRHGVSVEVMSGAAYCMASTSMVLLNKAALSSFGFLSPNSLLLFQCVVALVLVQATHSMGFANVEGLQWKVVKIWLPVNFIFVGMIWTGTMSLKFLGVAMVTVLKNLTNLLVILGDYFIFSKRYPLGVWAALGLMIVSALCGSATDLNFNAQGYAWQGLNCVFTAAYSLYLKAAMNKVAALPDRAKGLDEYTMVYYNNLLSIPLIFMLAVQAGEVPGALSEPALQNAYFVLAASLSGIIGFAMGIASLWFLSSSTPTTYSLVGSLNKIPLALIGIVLFKAPTTVYNMGSIVVGLLAGTVFVLAKAKA